MPPRCLAPPIRAGGAEDTAKRGLPEGSPLSTARRTTGPKVAYSTGTVLPGQFLPEVPPTQKGNIISLSSCSMM